MSPRSTAVALFVATGSAALIVMGLTVILAADSTVLSRASGMLALTIGALGCGWSALAVRYGLERSTPWIRRSRRSATMLTPAARVRAR
ncbi:hypothetical protein [Microbacterium xanthum]|uniref:hypothetical protein n=1 Tax=Microbacterium xanthum TaxID=3079794 RepID=UPI002AD1ED6F|nr:MULTISPECIES: hypothetical protein [unclassified Microbacterium]MDZ8171682.1 hypothetical protein [Microbacterium sp. KSW-48]MDZ8200225.1 hypothetical protein [Microbacterium sp. SSW1-59]